jgi:hypothetical protein
LRRVSIITTTITIITTAHKIAREWVRRGPETG